MHANQLDSPELLSRLTTMLKNSWTILTQIRMATFRSRCCVLVSLSTDMVTFQEMAEQYKSDPTASEYQDASS